ncbi:MAG: Spy/CpxP family protein refolding chaperone [Rubrivivax sp.]|nr:Spy/CpxP family protein refolding chaperone [Rubrivivax sp.]
MKTWIKRSLIGVFSAAVLFGGFAAYAHRQSGWHAMSTGDLAQAKTRVVDMAANRLDLDAAQKAKLGVLADQLLAQRQALVAGGDPRAQVQALVAGNSFDRAAAQALLDGKTQAVQAGGPALIAAFGDFYDSLQPEQQTKLRELMQRGGRHGERGERGEKGERHGRG